jgi:hypoxanthine phosphoribosyltransferase
LDKKLLISSETIKKRVTELATQISLDYEGRNPVLIGVLKGVVFFLADLARGLSIPAEIDFVRAASYGTGTTSSRNVRLTKDIETSVHGKPVILVEDIVDTGLTLTHIVQEIKKKGPESVKICALIEKLERQDIKIPIDYCGFRIKEGFIIGYGLDFDEKYRNLPDLYVLR